MQAKKNDVALGYNCCRTSVGSAVGQLAKIYGCRTIGLTSSDKKVAIVKVNLDMMKLSIIKKKMIYLIA